MRNLIVPLILVGVFGLSVGSALAAQEVSLHKHTAEELKSVCDKAGGRFSQDAGGHWAVLNELSWDRTSGREFIGAGFSGVDSA
jgi:hypothetical protein